MNWKKRTDEEVEASVDARDYTGGYEFWPWLLYMRIGYVVPILGMFVLGTCLIVDYESAQSYATSIGFGLFFQAGAIMFSSLLRKDYKKLKVGDSS